MPDYPAKQARGMRNVLVHDYDGLNLESLCETATLNIPVIGEWLRIICKYIMIPIDSLFRKLDGDRPGLRRFDFFCRVARSLRVNPDFEKNNAGTRVSRRATTR
jgi:Protein of unknown function DUF86